MPYLTVAEYLARFGNRETIVLTNDTPNANTVDEPKVEAAIADAEEFVESYVATRYAVPLVDPPRTLLGIVAVLARELLHKTRPTPEVTAAADRARSQLKDIAAGRATLLLDDATEVETSGDSMSQTSGDAAPVTFTREKLAGFTAIGGAAGYYDSAWKR
jgi:phage gp36-like protein